MRCKIKRTSFPFAFSQKKKMHYDTFSIKKGGFDRTRLFYKSPLIIPDFYDFPAYSSPGFPLKIPLFVASLLSPRRFLRRFWGIVEMTLFLLVSRFPP